VAEKDIQDYLDKGMYGAPQIKPDEQRKYLGTFRERVFLALTINEMKEQKHVKYFEQELKKQPDYHVLINGNVDMEDQLNFISVAQKCNCSFTVVETKQQEPDNPLGLVYAADEAINQEMISLSEKYSKSTSKSHSMVETEKTEKVSESRAPLLLKRIFKKEE